MITLVTVNTPDGEFELKFSMKTPPSLEEVAAGVSHLYPNWTSLVVVVLRISP